MKYKGLISVFISFIFLLVIIFTVFSVFTVKSVNVEFEVYASGRSTADIIDEKLSKYKGKNLLFLSTDDVLKEFDDYTYFEVVSAKKDYPNAMSLVVKERLARYLLTTDTGTFVISSDGFVLEKATSTNNQLLKLTVSNKEGNRFAFDDVKVGEKLSSSDMDALTALYDVIETEQISGFVTDVEIFSAFDKSFLTMYTATEVTIDVIDYKKDGANKASELAKSYADIDDYLKANSYLKVYTLEETNEIKVVWTRNT